MRRLLALTCATAALTLTGPPSAEALSCWGQRLTLGGSVAKAVGKNDEDGSPTYFRMRQVGSGRACTGGVDVFNSTTFVWTGARGVRGVWLDAYGVAGVNAPRTYLPLRAGDVGTSGAIDLRGVRYGAGRGDRTGGASGVIDRRWQGDIPFVVPPRTQR